MNNFIFKNDILKGKVAFITGGATGIGNGIARQMARAGADIVIASRTREKCEKAATELAAEFGIKARGYGMDVRESAQVNRTMKAAVDDMGSLDILVNNAAGNFYFPAKKLRDRLWNAVIDIDLNGTFYCCRAAYKYLKENGGTIISISATLQHNGWVGMAHAASAKAAIDTLTKTLALEWGRDQIRVNAIAPGPVHTEGVAKAFEMGGDFADWQNSIPLKRAGRPEEVGNMAVFMASEAGSWMTGSIVVLDGGEVLSARRAGIDPEQLDDLLKNRLKEKKG